MAKRIRISSSAILDGVRVQIQAKLDSYREALRRLDYKISRYDEAIRTGVLSWDKLPEEQAGDRVGFVMGVSARAGHLFAFRTCAEAHDPI